MAAFHGCGFNPESAFGKRGVLLTIAGLGIGLLFAAVAARSMTSLLYGFQPGYGQAMIVVTLVLMTVAAFACFVPARRASRLDPVRALQHE